MSATLETILTKLDELDLQELETLQEQLANKMRQKTMPTVANNVVATQSNPAKSKAVTIEELKKNPAKPLSPSEIKEGLAALERMRQVGAEISKDLPEGFDAVEAVNESRNRLIQ